jgi:hypothetical protein
LTTLKNACRNGGMMIAKSLLAQAKAFLCWDKFSDLTIKLVPLQDPVAFYYPPSPTAHTIVVFYPTQQDNLSQALFLLFHEIGHYRQFQKYRQQAQDRQFEEVMNMVEGAEKASFEREAWECGAVLLAQFLKQVAIPVQPIMQTYREYAAQCVKTYCHLKPE